MSEIITHRKCTRCGEVKLLSLFDKSSKSPLGAREICKDCRAKGRNSNPDIASRIKLQKDLKKDGLKKCFDCGMILPISDFRILKSTGKIRSKCIKCDNNSINAHRLLSPKEQKEKRKESKNRCRENKKEIYLKREREYRKNMPQDVLEKRMAYLEKYKKSDSRRAVTERSNVKRKDAKREWNKLNKVKLRLRVKEREKQDQNFLLRNVVRRRVSGLMRRLKHTKTLRYYDYIGCTDGFLKGHIESQFKEGMTWKNYGVGGWCVDHIKPCASFDLTDETQFKQCFHWSNMQPLWWIDNLKKGAKILS